MSIWKEIGKAINSTVKTANCQPLDKIIMGNKGLVASENLYSPLPVASSYPFNEPFDVLKMNWKGSIKITIFASVPSGSAGYVRINKNGSLVSSVSWTSSTNGDTKEVVLSGLEANDVISFTITNNDRLSIHAIDVFADVIDLSAFDIL